MAFVPEGQHDSSQARSAWTGVWPFSEGNRGNFTIFAAGDFLLVSKVGLV